MKLLVTGATGMLGTSLCRLACERGYGVVGTSRGGSSRPLFGNERTLKADLRSESEILGILRSERPEAIVHTAAVTDVDVCEKDPALAEAVNAAGTSLLARGAEEIGALLCYVSTDYVFDGSRRTPYREEDLPHPVNVYARTKWEGEKAASRLPAFYIARTSWLFGEGHDSFVHQVLRRAEAQTELRLVEDKWSIPSCSADVAAGLLALIERRAPFGIYHLSSGGGGCSWFGYGQEILRQAGLDPQRVLPMKLEALRLAAPRPPMTILNTEKFQRHGMVLQDWRKALGGYLLTVVSRPRRGA